MSSKPMTHDEIHTALCLWEAMLEGRIEKTLEAEIEEVWEAHGTNEMRFACIYASRLVENIWEALGDTTDIISFDWEFVPAVLKHIDWTTPTAPYLKTDTASTAAAMVAEFAHLDHRLGEAA